MILAVGLRHQPGETSFAHQSKEKVMQYRLQLQSVRKESLSLRAYLNKVKSCCDLLGAAGCKVFEGDQILHILAGLGVDYNRVVVTITSKLEELTVREVSALLTSFERRLDSAVKNSSINREGSIPTANLVQAENQRSNSNSNFRNGRNNYRGNGGRSFNFRGRGGRAGRSGGKIICQLCQKPGHGANKCWHRFEQNFVPTPPQVRNPNLQGQGGFNRMNPIANVVQARNQNVVQHTASPQYAPS
ncbi:uncharacterized protein LOC121776758 [Salvia splendens]|uniref:uncharacterized protein LOC121776758 n=1 Tax=Salvia splendens TaxID=180675 RepID=UPI001C26BC52|nr:uncharacterized protein LOC121776758 [Salvia splendens]